MRGTIKCTIISHLFCISIGLSIDQWLYPLSLVKVLILSGKWSRNPVRLMAPRLAPVFQRDNVVNSFRSGKIWVLICTALLARGIDFKGVNLVLNYDFPTSAVEYIHRIGGFQGKQGLFDSVYHLSFNRAATWSWLIVEICDVTKVYLANQIISLFCLIDEWKV